MNEVIEFLSQLIPNKEKKIYSNNHNELILELNLIIGIQNKNEVIKINLHKKNINLEETIFQLTKKIESMQEEINKLK